MHLLRRVLALFRRDRLDRDMDEELRTHLERETEQNIARGMTPDEARFAARRAFGGLDQLKERERDARGWRWLENVWRDLRFAVRSLSRNPVFTAVAIATLALGVGLNTAMFSFVNSLMLRPLPYQNPDELVQVYRPRDHGLRSIFFPASDFLDLQRAESPGGEFLAYQKVDLNLDDSGRSLTGMRTSSNFFRVLGVHPVHGRGFAADEGRANQSQVAVISDGVWLRQFGRASDVIGKTIRANGEIYEVVGVLPPSAAGAGVFAEAGIFTLLSRAQLRRSDSGGRVAIMGRRNPTVSPEQAAQFIAAFGRQRSANTPADHDGGEWRCETVRRPSAGTAGVSLVFLLFGLSLCVLAVACSNLANLLLARATERTQELAVRAALGASRWQLIRPLALEVVALAILGGAASLFVLSWTTDWLDARVQHQMGVALGLVTDHRVLGFVSLVSLLTMAFFGVGPALFATRVKVNENLKSGVRNATGSRSRQRFRAVLITGQFAFAMVLIAGAGFFLSGGHTLLNRSHGWTSDNVIKGEVTLPEEIYVDDDAVIAFQQRLTERLQALTGAAAVSLSGHLPYTGMRGWQEYVIEGRPGTASEGILKATPNPTTPDYFRVTGTRLTAGRFFAPSDNISAPKVAIINESLARSLFPYGNAIGHRLARADASDGQGFEIVGVVTDTHSVAPAARSFTNQLYRPLAQAPSRYLTFAIKTHAILPGQMIQSIRSAVAELDPRLIVRDTATVNQDIASTLGPVTMCRQLLSVFAALGLFLATLGIYGVLARHVAQRSGEIGVRMALGARMSDILRLVLGFGIRIAAAGVALGIFGAWCLATILRSMLPGMQADGAWVVAISTLLLTSIALLACWLPARRAARVDPVIALRAE